jgi:DNA-binding MarR family transcriptional regulator
MTEMMLTSEDFDGEAILVSRSLIRSLGGNVAQATIFTLINNRCRVEHPDDTGLRWWKASSEDIAEAIGVSTDKVQRAIKALVDDGLLVTKIDNLSPWDRTRSYRPSEICWESRPAGGIG